MCNKTSNLVKSLARYISWNVHIKKYKCLLENRIKKSLPSTNWGWDIIFSSIKRKKPHKIIAHTFNKACSYHP